MTMPPPLGSSLPADIGIPPDLAEPDAATTLTAVEAEELGLAPAVKPRGLLRRGWEVFAENKLALASLGLLVFIVLFCFAGPLFYHTDQVHTNLSQVLCPPSGSHPLGCDNVGYDQLGRLMIGGQTSLEVGVAAAIVAVLFGTLYGAVSGFIGGVVDSFLMRVVDAGLSIPYITLVIILSVAFHPNRLTMIFVIAVFYWLAVSRLIRGEALTLRTREYVQAVKVIGGRSRRAVIRHILPNAIGTIIVQATFAVADSIIILASLGFLGLGVQAPATDWGSMLSGGLNYLQSSQSYWWLIYPAGIAIILTCISVNFIGDALRDAFETRLQRR
ncbi:MAG TPA: ABC transporter permease [Streptosporangiaceae bacterium]|jgi:peptide/nickel transport system permease protein|nr:ABC transporter permease [Streptosporangiaceae bacterium]